MSEPRITDMSSISTTQQEGGDWMIEVLPHLALPILLFLTFYTTPFRGRGAVFAVLIIGTDIASKISDWPPNVGESRAMRYGLAGSWLFALPTLERALLHSPEHDFWLIREAKAKDKGRPKEFTWGKACWACRLVSSPRAVGWNFGSSKLNASCNELRIQGVSKPYFVFRSLARAVLAYFALDTVVFAVSRNSIPSHWSWNIPELGQIAYVEVLMGISVYVTMTLQYDCAAAIAVGFTSSQPEDWPPLFGNIADCYTIANVWGKFWHGYIRQPCLSLSHALIDCMGIPRKSILAYMCHLTTAFFISGVFHIWTLAVIAEGYISKRALISNLGAFFMVQPLATIAEATVIHCWQNIEQSHENERRESSKALSSSIGKFCLPVALTKGLGYAWVVGWFLYTGWWFIKPYAAIGVTEWPLPFSFWRDILAL